MDRILVVEDEPRIGALLRRALEGAGYAVESAGDGRLAIERARTGRFDLVLLDLMLPEVPGIAVLREVMARDPEQPVMVLSAVPDVQAKVRCLDLGAADYVTKPFSPGELVSRVKAVLRRAAARPEEGEAPIDFGELRIDPRTREVVVRGRPVELTATEFNLLWFLAAHPRQVFRRDQLLEQVWGYSDYLDPGTVTVHIRRLREKIERDPAKPVWLLTVWGVGYRLEPGAA